MYPELAGENGYNVITGVADLYAMYGMFVMRSDLVSPYVYFNTKVNAADLSHLSKLKYQLYGISK